MLKCDQVVQRADELVDGTALSFRERLALRMHLLICHHCRRYLRQLKLLVAALRRSDEPAEPADVDRILHALDSSGND